MLHKLLFCTSIAFLFPCVKNICKSFHSNVAQLVYKKPFLNLKICTYIYKALYSNVNFGNIQSTLQQVINARQITQRSMAYMFTLLQAHSPSLKLWNKTSICALLRNQLVQLSCHKTVLECWLICDLITLHPLCFCLCSIHCSTLQCIFILNKWCAKHKTHFRWTDFNISGVILCRQIR